MGVIVSICQWIYNALKRFLLAAVSVGGAIVAAITGFGAMIYGMLREYTPDSFIVDYIEQATDLAETLVDAIEGTYGETLLYMFAVDKCLQFFLAFIAFTFGLLLSIIGVTLTAVFAFIPTVMAAQVTMKVVKTATGGFVDP